MSFDPEIDPALERIEFMWQAIAGRGGWCKQDDNWRFGWGRVAYWNNPVSHTIYTITDWAMRVLVTLKCLICIALDREYHGDRIDAADWPNVAIFNFYGWQSMDFWGTAYDFDVLAVERGWRNWQFVYYHTGTA